MLSGKQLYTMRLESIYINAAFRTSDLTMQTCHKTHWTERPMKR